MSGHRAVAKGMMVAATLGLLLLSVLSCSSGQVTTSTSQAAPLLLPAPADSGKNAL